MPLSLHILAKKGAIILRTKILHLDLLCSFSYIPLDNYCLNKTLGEICEYLIKDNSRKLQELIYYNRLYSRNLNENLPIIFNDDKNLLIPAYGQDNSKLKDLSTCLK